MSTQNDSTNMKPMLVGPDGGESITVVGDRVRILADSDSTAGQCAIFDTFVAPGLGPPLHRHQREDEYFYVQAGTAKFSIEGKVHTCGPGTFLLAPRGSVHTFVNAGATPLRMVISVTPGGLERPFRENAALFLRRPDASFAELEAIFKAYGIEILGPPLSPHT